MTTIPLGGMSVEEFLANYWQKKPLLIRQAFPNFETPLEPEELAGLACTEGVMSRLILEQGGDYPWQLKSGPFSEEEFENRTDHHWTVLVQEVDRHVPAVADLFDCFGFLPSWRKDDVMVSYASRDAGVGAHIDSYDVFLLQGSGRRRWEIGEALAGFAPSDGGIRAAGSADGGPAGGHLDTSSELYKPGLDVRIMADFQATEVFELEPGDMLYLPPGVPHNGVAIEPCLTFSFGFLAPSRRDMVCDFACWHEENRGPFRYSDPDLTEAQAAGLITDNDLNRVLRMLQHASTDRDSLAEWFGTFITRPQRGPAASEEFEGSLEDFRGDFEESQVWRRHEGIRVAAWVEGEKNLLFADGEKVDTKLSAEQLQEVSTRREWSYQTASTSDELMNLLYLFTQRGWGYLWSGLEADEDDDDE